MNKITKTLEKVPRSIMMMLTFSMLAVSLYLTANMVVQFTEVDYGYWGTWVAPVLAWGLTVGGFAFLFNKGKTIEVKDEK